MEFDSKRKPIPSNRLWKALATTLDVFGPAMKEATILELQKNGLDLEKDPGEHSLQDIEEKLSLIFGEDGTNVILDQMTKKLEARH
ncbi:MAG: hypothetical protein ACREA4_08750 [Nitrososphaera sp.]